MKDYSRHGVKRLRRLCRERNLASASGTKAEMAARLAESDQKTQK